MRAATLPLLHLEKPKNPCLGIVNEGHQVTRELDRTTGFHTTGCRDERVPPKFHSTKALAIMPSWSRLGNPIVANRLLNGMKTPRCAKR